MSATVANPLDDLAGLFDDLDFKGAPQEERAAAVEYLLGQGSDFLRAQPDWKENGEAYHREFTGVAKWAREQLADAETAGQTAWRYAKVAGGAVRDFGGMIGTTVMDLNPFGSAPDTPAEDGLGLEIKMPGRGILNGLRGKSIKLVDSVDTAIKKAASGSNEQLSSALGELRKDIDEAKFPLHSREKFDAWLSKRSDHLEQLQRGFYRAMEDDGDWSNEDIDKAAKASRLDTSPEHVRDLTAYMATRSPEAWTALEKSILSNPSRRALEQDVASSIAVTETARSINDLMGYAPNDPQGPAVHSLEMAGDPLQIAAMSLPMIKGAQVAAQIGRGGSVASMAAKLGKGVVDGEGRFQSLRRVASMAAKLGKGVVIGEGLALGSQAVDDPTATPAERLQVAKDALAGVLGLEAVGLGVGAVRRKSSGAADAAASDLPGRAAPAHPPAAPGLTPDDRGSLPTPRQSAGAGATGAPAPSPDADLSQLDPANAANPDVQAAATLLPPIDPAAPAEQGGRGIPPASAPATAAPAAPTPTQSAFRSAAAALADPEDAPDPSDLSGIPMTPPTEIDPAGTIPESPETLHAQRFRVRAGLKPAMLLPGATIDDLAPEFLPADGEGMIATDTAAGVVLHNEAISPEEVQAAVANGQTGQLLGTGIPTKPENATHALVHRGPDGTPIHDVVVSPETEAQAVDALSRQSLEGDTIDREEIEEPVKRRTRQYRLTTPEATKWSNVESLARAEAPDLENLEGSAPRLDVQNSYFPKNLAGRARKIAMGFRWDGEKWAHPSDANATEFNNDLPAPKSSRVKAVFNALAKSYGRDDLVVEARRSPDFLAPATESTPSTESTAAPKNPYTKGRGKPVSRKLTKGEQRLLERIQGQLGESKVNDTVLAELKSRAEAQRDLERDAADTARIHEAQPGSEDAATAKKQRAAARVHANEAAKIEGLIAKLEARAPEAPQAAARIQDNEAAKSGDFRLAEPEEEPAGYSTPRGMTNLRGGSGQAGFVDVRAIGQNLAAIPKHVRDAFRALGKLPKFTPYRAAINTWVGRMQRSALAVQKLQKELEKRVPDRLRREAITNYLHAGGDAAKLKAWQAASKGRLAKGYEIAQNLTPDEIAVAAEIRSFYDQSGAMAQKEGVLKAWRDNYVNKVWKDRFFVSKLSRNFQFAKQATHENFFEGEQEGLVPATKDVSKLMGLYLNELHKTIATRRLIKDLTKRKASDGRPLAAPLGGTLLKPDPTDPTGAGGPGILVLPSARRAVRFGPNVEGKPNMVNVSDYKRLNHSALAKWKFLQQADDGELSAKPVLILGELAAHPEIADHLTNALGIPLQNRWINQAANSPVGWMARKVGSASLAMNSFVKQTMLSLSPFHIVQEGTHAVGHKVNPFFNIPKIDPDNIHQQDAMNHGLMLGGDDLAMRHFMDGLGKAPLLERVPYLGPVVRAISDFTFHTYIPGLKFKTYEHIRARNMERFAPEMKAGQVTEADVKYLSARQTNSAYGHLNYKDIGRNPGFQKLAQASLLAPDFLEARGRFALSALQPGKVGAEQRVAMLTLAVGFYVAARAINAAANDGDPKWSHPFSVIVGGREYAMRSVPEDIYKLFSDSRKFIYGRLSPLIGHTLIESLTGKNYRGEKVAWSETMADAALRAIPISLRMAPGLRSLSESTANNPVSPWEQFVGSIGVQITRHSPITEAGKLASDFAEKSGKLNPGVYPISPYRNLRFALEDLDDERAAKEIEALKKTHSRDKLIKGFKASTFRAWTGSTALDAKFYRTLQGKDAALISLARQRRLEVWNRFARLIGAPKLGSYPSPH